MTSFALAAAIVCVAGLEQARALDTPDILYLGHKTCWMFSKGNIYYRTVDIDVIDKIRPLDSKRFRIATGKAMTPDGTTDVIKIFDKDNKDKLYESFWRVPCPKETARSGYDDDWDDWDDDDEYGWNGGFGGGQLATSWSRVSTDEWLAATGLRTNHFEDSGDGGLGGGLNVGYNWRPWKNRIVVGIVADASGLSDRVDHTFANGTFIGSTVNFMASADARMGVTFGRRFLLYAQSGASVANQRLQINFGGPVTDTSQFTPGINVGAGAEWKLGELTFGRHMSLFFDYKHFWWDHATLNMPAASPAFNYGWTRQSDVATIGFRIPFGSPPASGRPTYPVKALPTK